MLDKDWILLLGICGLDSRRQRLIYQAHPATVEGFGWLMVGDSG